MGSKWYVMYGEHFDGGLIGIKSQDVEFIKDEFLRIGDVDKESQL